jgi:hypothetical protein
VGLDRVDTFGKWLGGSATNVMPTEAEVTALLGDAPPEDSNA